MRFGVINLQADEKSAFASTTLEQPSLSFGLPTVVYSQKESKAELFEAQLSPHVHYFIDEHWGLQLHLGGIAYQITDWKSADYSFRSNFSPKYWSFGINYLL